MELETLRDLIEKEIDSRTRGKLNLEESDEYFDTYSESLVMESDIKYSTFKKILENHIKKELNLEKSEESYSQRLLRNLLNQSSIFSSLSREEVLSVDTLKEKDISPYIMQEDVYKEILNETSLDERVKLYFVVSVDESDEEEENHTYQLDLHIKTSVETFKIIGGECVDLNSASNNPETLAKWLTSNILA